MGWMKEDADMFKLVGDDAHLVDNLKGAKELKGKVSVRAWREGSMTIGLELQVHPIATDRISAQNGCCWPARLHAQTFPSTGQMLLNQIPHDRLLLNLVTQ